MSTPYPEGFHLTVGQSGAKALSYYCDTCKVLYRNIPDGSPVLCCGQMKRFDKSLVAQLVELALGKGNGGTLVDDKPVKVNDRIFVPVDL